MVPAGQPEASLRDRQRDECLPPPIAFVSVNLFAVPLEITYFRLVSYPPSPLELHTGTVHAPKKLRGGGDWYYSVLRMEYF
jgi:hypothetical protein